MPDEPLWPELVIRYCALCSQPFSWKRVPADNSRKYCSTVCAREAERNLQAQRYKRWCRRQMA